MEELTCPKCGKPLGSTNGHDVKRLVKLFRAHYAAEHQKAISDAKKIRALLAAFRREHRINPSAIGL